MRALVCLMTILMLAASTARAETPCAAAAMTFDADSL